MAQRRHTQTTAVQVVEPFYLRRRDTAAALGVSESQVLKYEREGRLPVVRLPGLRAVRHDFEDVKELARKLRG